MRCGCGRAVVRLLAMLLLFVLFLLLLLGLTAPADAGSPLLVDEIDTKARMEARAERGEAMGGGEVRA